MAAIITGEPDAASKVTIDRHTEDHGFVRLEIKVGKNTFARI
jgi:hypothetical protein